LDSMNLRTTEAYQEVADHLLDEERYAYFETKDKIENGKVNVSKTSLSTRALLNCNQPMQVVRKGCYHNGLVVQTLAQCWINFEDVVDVPGFVNGQDIPYATVVLSATSVSLSVSMILAILTMYRFIVLSGSGQMDISPRRAMMLQSQAKAVVLSKSRVQMASTQRQ